MFITTKYLINVFNIKFFIGIHEEKIMFKPTKENMSKG